MDICETHSDRKLFCNDWEFYKAAFGSDYSEDFAFKPVDIPHDWLIYNTNDLYETSTGWYRKAFSYQKKEGIRTFIRFDGVYMDSKVYVNGALAGEWKYGYSAFMFDITDLMARLLGESASGTLFLTRTAKRWQAMSLTLVGRIFPAYLRRCV